MKTHKRKELKSAEILVFVILLVCHVFPLQANLTAVRNLDNGSWSARSESKLHHERLKRICLVWHFKYDPTF